MKTQKTKQLRYLSPEYVSEPNRFIKEVVYQWGINWSLNFGFLFSYSMCPTLDKNRVFNYGFTYIHLAQMIEAAYIILKERNWQPTSKNRILLYNDPMEVVSINQKENINGEHLICDFFGFMDLRSWYNFLDELLLSSDIKNNIDLEILPTHLIAREFIVLLPNALLALQNNDINPSTTNIYNHEY